MLVVNTTMTYRHARHAPWDVGPLAAELRERRGLHHLQTRNDAGAGVTRSGCESEERETSAHAAGKRA